MSATQSSRQRNGSREEGAPWLTVRVALTIVAAVLAPPGAGLAEGWTSFRGNALRSGDAGGSSMPEQLEIRWRFRNDDYRSPSFDASPAISDGAVLVGMAERSVFSPAGRVVCLDGASGKRTWDFKTRYPVFSSPVVAGGRVFSGEGYHQDSECRLYCLDAATGAERWVFQTKSHIESTPHVADGRVYFGAGEDGLYCVGAEDGKAVWHFPGGHVDLSPLVTSGLVFAGTGYGQAAAFCLAAKDGEVRWKTPVDLPCWGSPVRVGNRVYYGLGSGSLVRGEEDAKGAVLCLGATSGEKIWQRDLPGPVLTAIAFGGGKIFCGSRDAHIYALDPNGGAVLWKLPLGAPVIASPLVGERAIAGVSQTGRLTVAAIASGEVLATLELEKILGEGTRTVSSPALSAGQIIVCGGGSVLSIGSGQGAGKEGKP